MLPKWWPQVELRFLKDIDFFPPRPADFSHFTQLCIGTKSRKLGDSLMLTTLPQKLKAKYPNLKRVTVYPRGYNGVVFFHNPFADGFEYLPDALWGDDCDFGSGQMLNLKEQFFDLDPTSPPAPVLFLDKHEKERAQRRLSPRCSKDRLIVIHPFASRDKTMFSELQWNSLVLSFRDRVDFVQVGIVGNPKIEGCVDYALFDPKQYRSARDLFAIIDRAHGFIGMDSGPMHVARALKKPLWIATPVSNLDAIFERRKRHEPYFLYHHGDHAFLYDDVTHFVVKTVDERETRRSIGSFLEKVRSNEYFKV